MTDNGVTFSVGFKNAMSQIKNKNNESIEVIHGSVRHPQTQGVVERFNGILLNAFKRIFKFQSRITT